MKLFYVAGAVAVILAADTAVLISVGASRRGGPDAVLRVSEREFEAAVESTDNSAVILDPRYGEDAARFGAAVELAPSQAAALGVSARLGRSAAKRVFAALEVRPDAAAGASRLRIAGMEQDPAAVRARYPDRNRYAVVRAVVRIGGPGGPSRRTWVVPLPESIYVPTQYTPALRRSPRRFNITLCYSREGDCWVCGAETP
jgi:hypothetical protein